MAIRSYVKNEKKFYEAYVNGFNAQGKRVQQKRSGLGTLRKAELAEFELKRKLALLKENKVHPTWDEWLTECLQIMKVAYRPSTLYSVEKTLSKWVKGRWDKRDLPSITRLDVHEFIFEVMPPEVSQHTRKWVLKIIKRIFQMAVDHGKLAQNPCNGMMVKVPETDKKVLTSIEVGTFLNEAKVTNHRFYSIWTMALFTGCRSGELYALRWSDVDFEAGTISVSRSWNSKNGFTCTKNQKMRVVPISSELMAFLKGLKLQRGVEEFILPHLTEWSRGEAARVTKAFCKSLGITDIRFHDLRATFITSLLARGESLARVMAIVGHSDMETTNVYLRKAGIELKGGTEKLGYKIPSDTGAEILQFQRS